MKKVFKSVLAASSAMVLMAGCGSSTVKIPKDAEVVNMSSTVDRVIYRDLDSLEKASDLIVIGKFTGNASQKKETGGYERTVATNTLSIKKVLKGTTTGDRIKVSQTYGYDKEKNQLISYSALTPMEKGDEWVFFLHYDNENDTYWCSGDYTGRYPVLNDDLASMCEELSEAKKNGGYEEIGSVRASCLSMIKADEFGVYEKGKINLDLYSDIINAYDCKL